MILMIFVAALFITSTAMTQTPSTISGKYSDSLSKLPPLKADFEISLFPHSQPSLLQMSHENKNDKDSLDIQSVMFHHKERNTSSQYHYKARPDYTKMVDNFQGTRDWIVRKRRREEGRPLQPLPPPLMRKR